MLRLHQLELSLDDAATFDSSCLRRLCAQRLHLSEKAVAEARLVKRSVDARSRGGVHFSLTADVTLAQGGEAEEKRLASRFKPNQVTVISGSAAGETPDVFGLKLPPWPADKGRPLVVGAGPAGLFCALALAARGARPILVERGKPVEARSRDVEQLETRGEMDPESNVLFGEGGAGAFSDGKLTCGLNSPHIRTVLGTLVRCGAPEEILVAQRPHIGTDELRRVLVGMRAALTRLGAEIRFETRLTGLILQKGRVTGRAPGWRRRRGRAGHGHRVSGHRPQRARYLRMALRAGPAHAAEALCHRRAHRASAARYRPGAVRPLSGGIRRFLPRNTS